MALAVATGLRAAPLDFAAAGFRIDSLEASPAGITTSPVLMCLPPTEAFAPNVNVQIQPFPESIEKYITLSKAQFAQEKWRVIAEKREGPDTWTVEYVNPDSGGKLHHYSRAIANGRHVYLATATAKESQWDAAGAALRKCVDSFTLK